MTILKGDFLAQKIKKKLKKNFAGLKIKPGLAVILIGNNKSSQVYVRQKEKIAKELGVNFKKYLMPAEISQKKINDLIEKLNKNKKVQGILVQLPLPKNLNADKVIQSIERKKDVDGFYNPSIIPPVIAAILELLKGTGLNLSGKKTRLLTKGKIFTKSLKNVLKSKGIKITNQTNKADILIVALGKPKFIKAEMIKNGAVVVDVGFNRINGKLTGDVDFKDVVKKVKFITPVPGGVGPLTVIFLFKNLLKLSKL